jgi:hypothetical protein
MAYTPVTLSWQSPAAVALNANDTQFLFDPPETEVFIWFEPDDPTYRTTEGPFLLRQKDLEHSGTVYVIGQRKRQNGVEWLPTLPTNKLSIRIDADGLGNVTYTTASTPYTPPVFDWAWHSGGPTYDPDPAYPFFFNTASVTPPHELWRAGVEITCYYEGARHVPGSYAYTEIPWYGDTAPRFPAFLRLSNPRSGEYVWQLWDSRSEVSARAPTELVALVTRTPEDPLLTATSFSTVWSSRPSQDRPFLLAWGRRYYDVYLPHGYPFGEMSSNSGTYHGNEMSSLTFGNFDELPFTFTLTSEPAAGSDAAIFPSYAADQFASNYVVGVQEGFRGTVFVSGDANSRASGNRLYMTIGDYRGPPEDYSPGMVTYDWGELAAPGDVIVPPFWSSYRLVEEDLNI